MSERRFDLDGEGWIAIVDSERKGTRTSGFQVVFRRADGTLEVTGIMSASDLSLVSESDLKQVLRRALFAH